MLDCCGVCRLCTDILRVSRTAAKTDKDGLGGVKSYRIAPTLTFSDSHAQQNIATPRCHMPEAQLSNPRKRRNPERLTPQHGSKRQKHSHPSGSEIPPAFWENLSRIDLTKRALKELDRRNTQAALASRSSCSRPHRPITRRVLAELKKSCQPLTPAVEYIYNCGTRDLKDIKQTARHGGPDLSDLRGVCR